MGVTIHRLDQRPDLVDRVYDMDDGWPEFMGMDPVANALMWRVAQEFPHLCLVGTEDDGSVVARGRAVPFVDRGQLPDGGLDRILVWAFGDRHRGRTPTLASAIEIAIDAGHQGQGLSHQILGALREAVRAAGLSALVAPVRPNHKDRDPTASMADYISRTRYDGL